MYCRWQTIDYSIAKTGYWTGLTGLNGYWTGLTGLNDPILDRQDQPIFHSVVVLLFARQT